jgi:hypothetical protein
MVNKIKIFLFIGIIITPFSLYPCTCKWVGNFINVSKTSDLVILFKVVSYDDYFTLFPQLPDPKRPMSINVEIIEIIRGTETRKSIKIFGDNGFLCRSSIRHLEIGKYYIAALHKTIDYEWDYGIIETKNDFSISACGEYLVNIDKNLKVVTGRIRESDKNSKKIKYEDLKRIINE